MGKQRQEGYPDWFLWLWERGFAIGSLVALIGFAIVLLLVWHLDERLADIEDRLTRMPPPRYQAPDLEARVAEPIPESDVALRQAVYVPVYSHVYYRSGRPYLLETTLGIRNTDPRRPLYVESVRYYDTQGKLVRAYVDRLIRVEPLETLEFLVEVQDTTGGSGANFLVEWLANEPVEEPLIEAVMVGTTGTHAISFRSTGRPIGAE